MGVSEINRFPEDAVMYGRDANRLIDTLVLGNDGAQSKRLGYDGVIRDVNLGTTLSTGNYGEISQTTHGKHVSVRHSAGGTTDTPATQVFAVDDGFVTIGRGKELRFYNTAGTNSANFYHSGTNDVIKSDDGLQIVGAVNVGSSINATDAGDIWASGGISLGTYSNPANGQLLCDTITTTGNVTAGNDNADAHTFIGLSTFRNSASSAFPLYVDAANNRAQFGSTSALSGATNSKVEVNGGRSYFAAGSEVYAVAARYGPTTGDVYFGASNASAPDGIISNNGGTQILRTTNGGTVIIGTATAPVGEEYLRVQGAVLVSASPAGTPNANALYSATIPKVLMLCDGAGNLGAFSFNVSAVTKSTTGIFTITFDRDFSAATYVVQACAISDSAYYCHARNTGYTSGACQVAVRDAAGTLVDPNNLMVAVFGPQ